MGTYCRQAVSIAHRCLDNRHRLGAVIVSGGRIISKAHNLRTRHAEHRAVSPVWKSELKGATIYVARPLHIQPGAVGMARPCHKCLKLLREVGIVKVVYSNDSGGWTVENI